MAPSVFAEQYLCFRSSGYYEKLSEKNKPPWCLSSCDNFTRTEGAVQAKRVLDRLIDSCKNMKRKQRKKLIAALNDWRMYHKIYGLDFGENLEKFGKLMYYLNKYKRYVQSNDNEEGSNYDEDHNNNDDTDNDYDDDVDKHDRKGEYDESTNEDEDDNYYGDGAYQDDDEMMMLIVVLKMMTL